MKFLHTITALALAFFLTDIKAAEEQKIDSSWSWLYYKILEHNPESRDKAELHFIKEDIPSFTQLIFSWNARRPAKGHFSFWVSARNSKTKQWGTWHRMIDWGAGIQKSHLSKSNYFSRYHHVRLEIPNGTADAFKIRIMAHENVEFSHLKAFAVALANFNNFQAEEAHDLTHLKSVHISGVPKFSQFLLDHPKNDTLCSPTSCSMLSSFLLGQEVNPIEFAQQVYDEGLDAFGSWPFNMAHAFELCKGEFWFFTARLNSFVRLHQRLQKGVPVVVSVRGPLEGGALPYKHGHLLVVVGWDAKKQEVICHDPAFKTIKEVVQRYSAKEFLTAWERSKRLAYIVEPTAFSREK